MNSAVLDLTTQFFSESSPLSLFVKSAVSLAAFAFFASIHKLAQLTRFGTWLFDFKNDQYGTSSEKLESFNFEMASTSFCFLSTLLSLGFDHFAKNNPDSPFVKHYQSDPMNGYSRFAEMFLLFITGYFLWDTGYQLVHCTKKLVPYLLHAVSCLLAFVLLVHFQKLRFGLMFITFEFSVAFLKIMTLLSLTGHHNSPAHKMAALLMAITFIYYRIYLGFGYYLGDFINGLNVTLKAKEISISIYYIGWACIIALYGLNLVWLKDILCKMASLLPLAKAKKTPPLSPSTKARRIPEKNA